jgi:TonB C terminal
VYRAPSVRFLSATLVVLASCAARDAREATAPRSPDERSRDAVLPATAAQWAHTTAAHWAPDAGASVADAYVREVPVVDRAPSPAFLLAQVVDVPNAMCETRLFARARSLGANQLYVDPKAPCRGGAYFVPSTGTPPGEGPDTGIAGGGRGSAGNVMASAEDARAREARRAEARACASALRAWLLARWKRPPSLSAADSRRLCMVVQFTVSPMRRVWKVNGQPVRSSGSREFDESVRAALESAIDEHATVPAPPRDLIGEHVEYRIEFTEGDPTICRELPP